MNKYVVIVAGGSGSRMGSNIPKQFLEIHQKPIILHTIDRFFSFDPTIQFVIVMHKDWIDFFQKICFQHNCKFDYSLLAGGETRFDSCKIGIDFISEKNCLIAVHDAARPMVSTKTISDGFELAKIKGAAIPVTTVKDSLRKISKQESKIVHRDQYRIVQTPQVFQSKILKQAYDCEFNEAFTDDASVVELQTKQEISLYEGTNENIKITTPLDLKIASLILEK